MLLLRLLLVAAAGCVQAQASSDADSDGIADTVDSCPETPYNDIDNDGLCDSYSCDEAWFTDPADCSDFCVLAAISSTGNDACAALGQGVVCYDSWNNDGNDDSQCLEAGTSQDCLDCDSFCSEYFAVCVRAECLGSWSAWGACAFEGCQSTRTWTLVEVGQTCGLSDGDAQYICEPGADEDSDGACTGLDACPLDALDDVDSDGFCANDDPCPSVNCQTCYQGGVSDTCYDAQAQNYGTQNECEAHGAEMLWCTRDTTDCVGAWTEWDTCSSTCGGGTQQRQFNVSLPAGAYGTPCDVPANASESQVCNSADCPVDCVGVWNAWSDCSETCGPGTISRTFVVAQAPANGGVACSSTDGIVEQESCISQCCDSDSDGICNDDDTCLDDSLNDSDSDGICDAHDTCLNDSLNDGDLDGICDEVDSCPNDALSDGDSDAMCDGTDSCLDDALNDQDSDGVCSSQDSCPMDSLNDEDSDSMCAGDDLCPQDSDNDADSDSSCANADSCPFDAANDIDSDAVCGDVDSCVEDAENDADGDNSCSPSDVCRYDAMNDADSDSICGDVDSCPLDAGNDVDSDAVCGDVDSCVEDAENDADGDNSCSPSDVCRYDAMNDADSDSICGDVDSCPLDAGNDVDSDAVCGDVDSCVEDAENDADGDNSCSLSDVCRYDAMNDADSDSICGDVDSCPLDAGNDVDSDAVCGDVDSCVEDAENDADGDNSCSPSDVCRYDAMNDADSDSICGDVDSCPLDAGNDVDSDAVCGDVDSCVEDAENDADGDNSCSPSDVCRYDAMNDADSDSICGDVDTCPLDAGNDVDSDAVCGDVDSCVEDAENDADGDNSCSPSDVCRYDAMNDADSDSICGDVDSCPLDAGNDVDSDAVCGDVDSCVEDAENDADGDNSCSPSDVCRYDAMNDADSDSICGDVDSCPLDAGNDVDSDAVCGDVDSCVEDAENDADGDNSCSPSDVCRYDAMNDADSDSICGDVDSCPLDAGNDVDSDAVCGDVDSCVEDAINDADGDSICGDVDSCPADRGNDVDNDSICGEVDICPADALNDSDSDAICDGIDVCVGDSLNDGDSDAICDGIDGCIGDALNDADSDKICDSTDSCPSDKLNDGDDDGICDLMDSCKDDRLNDMDSDRLCHSVDSCPSDFVNDYDSDSFCDGGVNNATFEIDVSDLVNDSNTTYSSEQLVDVICRTFVKCDEIVSNGCNGAAVATLRGGASLVLTEEVTTTIDMQLAPAFNFSSCDTKWHEELSTTDMQLFGITDILAVACPAECASSGGCESVAVSLGVDPTGFSENVCHTISTFCSPTKPADCAFFDSDSDGVSDLHDPCPLASGVSVGTSAGCGACPPPCSWYPTVKMTIRGSTADSAAKESAATTVVAALASGLSAPGIGEIDGGTLQGLIAGSYPSTSAIARVTLAAAPGEMIGGVLTNDLSGMLAALEDISQDAATTVSLTSTTPSLLVTSRAQFSSDTETDQPALIGGAVAAIVIAIVMIVGVVVFIRKTAKQKVFIGEKVMYDEHGNVVGVKERSGIVPKPLNRFSNKKNSRVTYPLSALHPREQEGSPPADAHGKGIRACQNAVMLVRMQGHAKTMDKSRKIERKMFVKGASVVQAASRSRVAILEDFDETDGPSSGYPTLELANRSKNIHAVAPIEDDMLIHAIEAPAQVHPKSVRRQTTLPKPKQTKCAWDDNERTQRVNTSSELQKDTDVGSLVSPVESTTSARKRKNRRRRNVTRLSTATGPKKVATFESAIDGTL